MTTLTYCKALPTPVDELNAMGKTQLDKFGKYVESKIGDFARNINRLPATGAKTWHFYYNLSGFFEAVEYLQH